MARCGCSSACVCSVTGSGCIGVSGDGSPAAPFTVGVLVDSASSNLLECGETGLLVELQTADTTCIELSGTGVTGLPLFATPIIDPDPDNILECGLDGLFVNGNDIVVSGVGDTSCILLSGDGTLADPLLATPVIDPDLDNILECGIAGLFVDGSNIPVAGVGDTDCILLSGDGTVGDPLLATPVIAAVAGNILECGASGLVAGGADFKTWVTAISTAANFGAMQAATVTYLATLP